MNAIADALVFAVWYINNRGPNNTADDDVRALENIAASLQHATRAEEDALAAAAKRALADDRANSWSGEGYTRWMQDVFGESWNRNERIQG